MPDINTMKESRFLKKEDCGASGILVTIRTCELMNIAKEGAPEEMKWCLTFEEIDKPYVSNVTNRAIIAAAYSETNTDNWGGFKIVLYNNPTISFGGKITGGISARAPRNQAAPVVPAPKPASPPARMPAEKIAQMPGIDEDVPF